MYKTFQTPEMTCDLDQPRLELVVDDDVIPVALEAVLVVVHDGLQTGRGTHYYDCDLQLNMCSCFIRTIHRSLMIWTYSHGFERLHHDPVDLVKQVVGDVPSSSALQIEPQVTDRPLPAVNVIVVVLRSNIWELTGIYAHPLHAVCIPPVIL